MANDEDPMAGLVEKPEGEQAPAEAEPLFRTCAFGERICTPYCPAWSSDEDEEGNVIIDGEGLEEGGCELVSVGINLGELFSALTQTLEALRTGLPGALQVAQVVLASRPKAEMTVAKEEKK